ncbi:hypothetical protein NEHOM01_2422 [Nematocida homosporus]|uniref:uncharacterized protein n=1 Tax=Nematocida homosporus TaxID=1912981 RepID=UPI0022204F41|nr:uncharacterized protein NEHOM01_2422 [Nematocida homosporus]KAI5187878.1 hypothetical protein NEHOM01_2422 [Nematocida homosporus]
MVFVSTLPLLDASLKPSDTISLLVGLTCAFRLLEFMFVNTNGHLLVWVLSTFTTNLFGFITINYDQANAFFEHLENRGGQAQSSN